MRPEIVEPLKQRFAFGQQMRELGGYQVQLHVLDHLSRFDRRLAGNPPLQLGVEGIDHQADGYGGTVAKAIVRHCFQPVGAPMTEIEWTRCAGLERVAGGGDMFDMEFGRGADDFFDRCRFAFGKGEGGRFRRAGQRSFRFRSWQLSPPRQTRRKKRAREERREM